MVTDMRKILTLIVLIVMVISANAQVDPIGKAFDTTPDNVYGILVGLLVALLSGLLAFIAWAARKFFTFFVTQTENKTNSDNVRQKTLEDLLDAQLKSNEILTGQAKSITEINGKVEKLEAGMESIEGKIGQIEEDLNNLKQP